MAHPNLVSPTESCFLKASFEPPTTDRPIPSHPDNHHLPQIPVVEGDGRDGKASIGGKDTPAGDEGRMENK